MPTRQRVDYADPFSAARGRDTPLLLLNTAVLRLNIATLRSAFPDVEIWYALKCNPHPGLAAVLGALGVGFEVASANELRLVQSLGIPSSHVMCLHPIKSPAFVRQLHDGGVSVLAVDCVEEVEKVARLAPGTNVVARIAIDGRGSRVPLGEKFGCSPEEAVALARHARLLGLRPAGVTMHVGSQCEQLASWAAAVDVCASICERLAAARMPPDLISLGGGLPVAYTANVPGLGAIGEVVRRASLQRFTADGGRITVEPGRAIAATAGTLVTSVVGTATRAGTRWVYLDAGVHQGLFEWFPAMGGLTMPISVEHEDRPVVPCRLAGPTCSSYDTLPGLFELPELRPGDRLAFHFAGAYSTVLATHFNGFDPPTTLLIDSELKRTDS